MYQQIGSFGPAEKHKTVSGHVPTSYHLDSADLLRHGSYGDRRPAASRTLIVLVTNRNGGKLRLNASRAGRKERRVFILRTKVLLYSVNNLFSN